MRNRRASRVRAGASPVRSAATSAWVNDPQSSTLPTILVCALFLTMILPPNLDYGALLTNANSEQNVPTRITLIVVIVGSCFLIARRPTLWLSVLRALNPFYLMFLALALVSLAWSINQGGTLHNLFKLGVVFLCFTAFTLYGWRASRFQSVMRALFGAVLVGSVIFAVAFPHYGVQQFEDYAPAETGRLADIGSLTLRPVLRGLTYGKNQMGQLAGLGLIFWVHGWLGKEVKTRWVIVCAGAALICLYWAHSSTSILATAFSVPVLLMLRHWPRWLRRYMRFILVLFTMLILGYSLVVLRLIPQLDFLLTPITALTGKDLTFSNRTAIWKIVIDQIVQHPLLGTGYSAYWVDEPGSPSRVFQTLMAFWPGESHNGYLDVLNDLGVVGFFCLLGYLFTYLRQSIKILEFDRHQGSLYVVLLFHQFWSCLSESHWFSAGSVSFTVITLAVCCLGRTLLQHRFEVSTARPPAYALARNGVT
jgi:exopolysaccharide production protein ExoQ